ncbi:serine threonine protein kinase : Serine/threonine protein kinase-related protein OS=Planctomyces limnophilus (strain ATCC 43296 / DSM 3776 / IFAM 1008 / 290) GN=Plim_0540 PE=3 SV=1: Pkinase [Gemmataceae bacterium]|nr:serine threonine protein kinase : Serine/threonine protein kinase-related protein OS=Planctomyces limnophilus (strain ATCC 43296 / DSM 3776 / IFAM 1008 / 290) GN=Plim_0540 PE=3 SV=1: Pkinase [Gemmataceae bacterium]VTT97197.1 serine threonine protein kinase : Serine/threonine protein kinase-related protein OS=Planctomyces limnophilus (strain ATCC 43296 / DSM 3776 / IFAM 1008 / 290) GN=Plim_0540 PE=3 SV=1: Pkinase [Gemmataceae bacterium]
MAQMWYIETGGRPEGPLTSKDLRDRAASGRLRPTDRVSPDGTKWAPAAKIKGLVFADTIDQQPNATVEVSVSASGSVRPVAVAQPPAAKPAPPPQPAKVLPGSQAAVETHDGKVEQIPGYEIAGVLGKGACGVVYRARQVKLDRTVALKMVLSDRRPSPAALARFDKEAVSLAKLRHPNIVGVYDCGHHDGRAYFAMELLDGEDLGARLDRTGRLDEFTAWHIARQTAAALAHAAELGVYHRDIKPANLFLTPPPTGYPLPPGVPLVKVTDFGLALTRQTGDDATDQRLTAAGVVLGTPAYMPPEQFAGSDIDHRADIYALGATVYHLLAGDAPFNGASVWEVMINKSGPTPRLGSAVSPETDTLVAAMMAQRPEDRIGTYRELLDRIDNLELMQGTARSLSSVRVPVLSPSKIAKAVPLPPDPDDEERTEGGDESDDAPRSRRLAKPQPKSNAKLYAFAVLGGLGVAAAVAVGVKFMGGPPDVVNNPPAKSKTGEFATGDREELFNRESILGWIGAGWRIDKDEEGTSVLAGKGSARRPFKSSKDYRVVLGIDLHEASVVEVVVATADGPEATAKRWSVRVDREKGAAFGVREGEAGAFQPLGATIPVPTKAEVDAGEKGRYSEVRYERAGGRVRAYFLGKPLGEVEDTGLTRTTEIRLTAEGGTVHIDTAAAEELLEK